MSPENPSTDYLESTQVNAQHLLTIPTEVQNLIFPYGENTHNKVYYWYIHKTENDEYLYISNYTPREENSETIGSSEEHSGSHRTSIPDKVIDRKNINEGDKIYFYAHDETKESENPSVAIFTEDQMTSKIDLGIESESDDDALFRPYTFTTPGMEEQDIDVRDLLDDVE